MEGTAEGMQQSATAAAERSETMYLVLRKVEGDDESKTWVEVGIAAGGPAPAMKALVETPGTYAAVPVRSWKPREVKVETKPSISFA